MNMKGLTKEHYELSVTKAGAVFTLDSGNNWEQEGTNAFVSKTYFDLAGMTKEDKTAFFQAAAVQDASLPSGVTAAGDVLIVADIMTCTPLTNSEAVAFAGGSGNFAGSQAKLTYNETIYGRNRIFISDIDTVNANYMVVIGDNQLGSLEPTASDRIYSTRVCIFGVNNADGTIAVYNARHLLMTQTKKEADYQYIMRLKKSYDLQQSFDVDGNRPH